MLEQCLCTKAKDHPDWHTKTQEGNFQPTPWDDWDDAIDFDYDNPNLRKDMTESLKYWITETNIDGFRCDTAGFITVDFQRELDEIKPFFMLAEWKSRDVLENAFNMEYSRRLFEKMEDATTRNKERSNLVKYLAREVNTFPKKAYKMNFVDNHDMNSWNGTPQKNFGAGLEIPTSRAFATTVNGMPLVYNGQEAGLDRSLNFFEKDPIVWKASSYFREVSKIIQIKT
jgi:cyclomaltodextrinase